ncbi:MAG: MFS transporter [Blastocatellia bacterium]|nr:MFS transporter [Blastocatellia bacterium]
MNELAHSNESGYWNLLRNNRPVRQLWLAQVVSEMGDWLNFVALVQTIKRFTPNAEAVGWLIVIQMLPFMLIGPMAGIVADRFNRRHVMIAADLLRMVIVLGYALIQEPGQLWLLYVLAGLHFSVTAFFEPARAALIPTIAKGEELLSANALTGVTWSMMLAIGGGLGGLIAGLFSPRTAFLADGATFFCSALLLLRMSGVGQIARNPHKSHTSDGSLVPAIRFLREHPRVFAVLLVKSGICITASGVWLLQVVYGQRVFPVGNDGAFSVGLLYGMHGLGAFFGAIFTNRFEQTTMRRSLILILAAFVFRSVFFFGWGMAVNLAQVAIATLFITACGSLLWVVSTTLLQILSPDEMRGRLFAIENALLTFSMASGTFLIGRALDVWHLSPAVTALATGGAALTVAFLWLMVVMVWNRHEPEAAEA